MIDRQYDQIVFECDCCEETWESDTLEFNPAWVEARRQGWKAKKIGSDWLHACPECKL